MEKGFMFMAIVLLSGVCFSYRPACGMQLYDGDRIKFAEKYTALGFQCLQENDVKGAIENYIMAGFGGNQRAYVILGEIYEASNNNELALVYYKKAQDQKNFVRLSELCSKGNVAFVELYTQ